MAVKLGHGRAVRGYASRRKYSPMADINVTPMVDVMLVLLVIFMITAPLLTVGVPVDLPKTKAAAMNNDDKPLVVSVKKDGSIYLQETEIDMDSLGPRLAAIIANKPDTIVYVRADKDINYGIFAEVLGELQSNGITKIGLVNDSKDASEPASAPKASGDSTQKPKSK